MTIVTTITDAEREAYRLRTGAGGCKRWDCGGQGRPEFAVWWKCPDGHREELRYCAEHGPEHLDMAVVGRGQMRCLCGEWMTPLVEGMPVEAGT